MIQWCYNVRQRIYPVKESLGYQYQVNLGLKVISSGSPSMDARMICVSIFNEKMSFKGCAHRCMRIKWKFTLNYSWSHLSTHSHIHYAFSGRMTEQFFHPFMGKDVLMRDRLDCECELMTRRSKYWDKHSSPCLPSFQYISASIKCHFSDETASSCPDQWQILRNHLRV